MKMNLFTLFIPVCVAAAVLSGDSESAHAASMPKVLLIKCTGEMTTLTDEHYEKVSEKTWMGDINRGYLFRNDYFYIDNRNNLKYTNIVSRETFTISDLTKEIGRDQLPEQIGYVDDEVIYFSTIEYDKNLPINNQPSHAFIYKVMRHTKEIEKLNITECSSPFFSVHERSIYFTAMNGGIHTYRDGNITALGVKGSYPTVSPDGRKIVFVSSALINTHLFLYDLIDKKQASLISFFAQKLVFEPIIRWSANSEFVATKQASDIKDQPIYLISTITGKVIQEIKNSRACNWFFWV